MDEQAERQMVYSNIDDISDELKEAQQNNNKSFGVMWRRRRTKKNSHTLIKYKVKMECCVWDTNILATNADTDTDAQCEGEHWTERQDAPCSH